MGIFANTTVALLLTNSGRMCPVDAPPPPTLILSPPLVLQQHPSHVPSTPRPGGGSATTPTSPQCLCFSKEEACTRQSFTAGTRGWTCPWEGRDISCVWGVLPGDPETLSPGCGPDSDGEATVSFPVCCLSSVGCCSPGFTQVRARA